MPQRYSKEDIMRFREDKKACDSKMIFWPDEQLVLVMERLGWKAGAASQPAGGGLLTIDRSKLFNPAGFSSLLNGFVIGEPEDGRSLALAAIDPASIRLETMLQSNETQIAAAERWRRLKASGYICLDAKIFEAFWQNQHLIPECWKNKIGRHIVSICFEGTKLRSPGGCRYVLYLFWDGGEWDWHCLWLGGVWGADVPSAVLAS